MSKYGVFSHSPPYFFPLLGIYGEIFIHDAGSGFIFKLTESLRMYQLALYFGPYKITSFSEKRNLPGPCNCLFNNLLDNLKKCDDFNLFCSRIFKFLENRAQAFST